MSDLISRSAVLKIIDEAIMNTSDFLQHDTQIDIQFKVEELPTAYDVDKVVEELEQQAKQYNRRALELVNKSTEAGIHNKGKACSYEHAIEIVKGGGVNER